MNADSIFSEDATFLTCGGEMGMLMRAHDWSTSPLGDPEAWPQSLRSVAAMMLGSTLPMCLAWGPELRLLYNDAYVEILGAKHPDALGAPLRDVWREVWPQIEPLVATALAGEGLHREDLPVSVDRRGSPEQAWFTFSYSPLRDESGRIAGLFFVVAETTAKVLGERRQLFRARLDDALRPLSGSAEITAEATRILCEQLGASRVHYGELEQDGEHAVVPSDHAPNASNLAGRWRMADFTMLAAECRAGRNFVSGDLAADPRVGDAEKAVYASVPVAAIVAAPLFKDERLAAILAVHQVEPHAWMAEEVAYAEETTGRIWEAIERARAEAQLRQNEARLRLALEAGRIGAWSLDVGADSAERSPLHDAIFGYSEPLAEWGFERFIGHVAPEDRAMVETRFRTALETASEWRFECRVDRADGVRRWIEARGAPVKGADGAVAGFTGIVMDIDDRREAERRVRESEARVAEERALLATLVEHLPLGVIVVDRRGKPLLCNPTYRRIVPEAVIPSQLENPNERWTGFDDQKRRIEPTSFPGARALRGETVEGAEFLHRSVDGDETWTRVSAVPLKDAAGNINGALCVIVDIDAHKRSEEALRQLNETLEQRVAERTTDLIKAQEALAQAQKMEAVGQLTGGIAHDFNNLLQGVSGSLDLIRRNPDDVERVRRWSEAGLQAAERGAKLTGQLLAFSRAQRIHLQPLIVADVIAEARDLLARSLGPMITLKIEVDAARVPVRSDSTQLEMAVLNLAINARDAMPQGGELTIATKPIRIESDPELEPGDYLELSVTDTGAGMPAEIAARAFDPFFTTKGVGKGTGLGLSQVYGIARQAGGTARIESRPGKGTTVRLFLRRTGATVVEQMAEAPVEIDHDPPGATVLVVDDDPDVRRFLIDSLDSLGFGTIEAIDGPAALAVLERATPDLMLVDFAMPGMTGAEVARAAQLKCPDLPIVFASGYAETAAVEDALGPGTMILRKPFRVDELHAAVAGALGGPA